MYCFNLASDAEQFLIVGLDAESVVVSMGLIKDNLLNYRLLLIYYNM